MLSRIRIAVAPAADYQAHRPLFDMLSVGLPVDFEPHTASDFSGLQGLIALSNDSALLQQQPLTDSAFTACIPPNRRRRPLPAAFASLLRI